MIALDARTGHVAADVVIAGAAYEARRLAPFDGSAVMASDGMVRVGLLVHSTAESTNDFTISGVSHRARTFAPATDPPVQR
jgi:hypothetical protein